MMQHDLYGLKNTLQEQGIFFCLSGPISQKLVTEIGAILEQKMSMEKASRTTIVRVFSLVVEKMQNIIHYSDERACEESAEAATEKPMSFGIIAIGYHDAHYFVLSGNVIANQKIEPLRRRLEVIQQMNREELKEYYRDQRWREQESGSKGAGLGLIEMAKKASKPIEFEFQPLNEEQSFFSMKTTI